MQKAAAGNHDAFGELIECHQHAVVGTVAKMTNGSPDSEDIAQQVFLRLWKSAPRYQPTAKFTTYLFTITRNLVFNETHPNSTARPDAELRQKELRKAIDTAISALPEKQRTAVILRRYENMPYDEIAQVLNLSISAVKSQLFRARTQLREHLERFLEE
nr:RNA polymerase sigma-H factor-like [Nerophis lumbriciformis]